MINNICCLKRLSLIVTAKEARKPNRLFKEQPYSILNPMNLKYETDPSKHKTTCTG